MVTFGGFWLVEKKNWAQKIKKISKTVKGEKTEKGNQN